MPRYDLHCSTCDDVHEFNLSYAEFDQLQEFGNCIKTCGVTDVIARVTKSDRLIAPMPSIHYKGYGFYSKDNLSSAAKYDYDHFDGSGTNAEVKAMERRIKDPESTVAKSRK